MQHGDELLALRGWDPHKGEITSPLVGQVSLALTNLDTLDSTSRFALCSSSLSPPWAYMSLWSKNLITVTFSFRLWYSPWLWRKILTYLLTSWRLSHVLMFIWGQTCSTAIECTGYSAAWGCCRKALAGQKFFFHCTEAQTCCITLACLVCGFTPDLQCFLYSHNSSSSHRLRSSDLVITPVFVSKRCRWCKGNCFCFHCLLGVYERNTSYFWLFLPNHIQSQLLFSTNCSSYPPNPMFLFYNGVSFGCCSHALFFRLSTVCGFKIC